VKREIASHVLAYRLRVGVRFLLQMFSVFLRFDVVRVIVGHAPYIPIRTCLIVAFAGIENLQYHCIEIFWYYVLFSLHIRETELCFVVSPAEWRRS
jgi:hypothetical protein